MSAKLEGESKLSTTFIFLAVVGCDSHSPSCHHAFPTTTKDCKP